MRFEDILPTLATKADLERFATKEDLKGIPTVDDPKGFVTTEALKKELERYPTKDDLKKALDREAQSIGASMREQFIAMRKSLREDVRADMAVLIEAERERWQALFDAHLGTRRKVAVVTRRTTQLHTRVSALEALHAPPDNLPHP